MTTKNEIIEILKNQFPTLKVGSNDTGYTELSADEYDATITEWANAKLARETKTAEAEANAAAKAALLDRLGITADEAKLLLS